MFPLGTGPLAGLQKLVHLNNPVKAANDAFTEPSTSWHFPEVFPEDASTRFALKIICMGKHVPFLGHEDAVHWNSSSSSVHGAAA